MVSLAQAEMPRDGHEGLLAGLSLSELGNTGVAQIVEAQIGNRALDSMNFGSALLVLAGLARILKPPTGPDKYFTGEVL